MRSIHGFIYYIYKRFFSRDLLADHLKRGLTVGKNFHMMSDVLIDISHTWLIEIGDNVTLAPRVHILTHDASTKLHIGYTKLGKVKIGNRVFVGSDSTILPGVTIGNDVVIGSGSIVTRDIDDRTVVAGNPAKFICKLEDFIETNQKNLAAFPRFEKNFTVEKGITDDMKKEMIEQMKDRFGYIR